MKLKAIIDDPKRGMLVINKYPTLYKRTKTGSVQYWRGERMGNKVRACSGKVGGKELVGAWTEVHGKNIGKVNETTDEQQAELQIKASWDKQIRMRRYFEDQSEIDDIKFLEPMLAWNWEDFSDRVVFPVWVDHKFNGVRCRVIKKGTFSRGGKTFYSVPHIREECDRLFEKYPDLVLDGELYNHEMNELLNRITSLVRKQTPTKAELTESESLVRYYVYDGYTPETKGLGFRARWIKLVAMMSEFPELEKYIVLVKHKRADDAEEVHEMFKQSVAEGYEGAIIRQDHPYTHGKGSSLLKYKPWITEEFEIVDITEGKGKRKGTAGRAWFVREHKGETVKFKANVKGDTRFVTDLWENRADAIGKMGTVEYAYLTEFGKPFHGYLIEIRDYE